MSEVRFRDDVLVRSIRAAAFDSDVVFAARVSTEGDVSVHYVGANADEQAGLIRYLMRSRHGSPFEHNAFTFYVEAPIFVFRELMRHRIASYNEESGRYKVLSTTFYVPSRERKLQQIGKTGAYEFIEGTDEQYDKVEHHLKASAIYATNSYTELLEAGVAKEVARMCLPVNTYSSAYVTMNARALMNFLSLRVADPTSTFPSTPQHEIDQVARQMEAVFAESMPLTHAAFTQYGRVAP